MAVGLGELDPTIARLVRKLAGKKWVVLYDSLKATFALQAQGLAREVVFAAMAVVDNEAALDSSGRRGLAETERTENFAVAIAGVQGCIAAWQAYKDWCEEVSIVSTRSRMQQNVFCPDSPVVSRRMYALAKLALGDHPQIFSTRLERSYLLWSLESVFWTGVFHFCVIWHGLVFLRVSTRFSSCLSHFACNYEILRVRFQGGRVLRAPERADIG